MHQALSIRTADGRVRYQWLRHGAAGNEQTLQEMRALVVRAVLTDSGLQDFANAILVRAGVLGDVRARSMREVAAIFDYVKYDRARNRGVIFRRDPAGGGDAIQDARTTIRRGFGDCDDFAVLLATLLGCVGYPTRFVVIRVDPETAGYDHVYLEVLHPDGRRWVALDATNEHAILGWEEPDVRARGVFRIFGGADGDELAGIKSFFKKVGRVALKVAPLALNVVPGIGTAASVAITAGLNTAQGFVDAKDAKNAQKAAQQPQTVMFSKPTGQYLLYADEGGKIRRASDGYHYKNEEEAWADGVARDWSNVQFILGSPPASLLARAQQAEAAVSQQAGAPAAQQAQQQQQAQPAQAGLLGGGLPSWVLPAGIGVAAAALIFRGR